MALLGGRVVTLCLIVLPAVFSCGEVGRRLAKDLFRTTASFPNEVIPGQEGPLLVSLKYSFEKIIVADTGINQVEILLIQTAIWTNNYYAWNKHDYNMCGHIIVPGHYTWLPDIATEDGVVEIVSPNNVKVTNEGTLIWQTRQRMRLSCDLQNIASASGSTCQIKMASWSYTAQELSLRLLDPPEVLVSGYILNPRYDLLNATLDKKSFELPTGQHEEIKLTFTFRDRKEKMDFEPDNGSVENTTSLGLIVCQMIFYLFIFALI